MWRHLSRGIQQGVKTRNYFDKNEPNVKDVDHKQRCCLAKFIPVTLHNLDPCITKKGDRDNHKQGKYENTTQYFNNHTILEAFGWSGAVAFGWVISKQWWLRQTWSKDHDSSGPYLKTVYYNLSDLLPHVVNTQPPVKYILPKLDSLSIKPKNLEDTIEEDEFEAAATELQRVHERAVGESLNRRGIASLSKSTGNEAIKYFKRASVLNYPPASFNLGQCCELGIGTQQDFKQAADWYKIASEQGHPTAMYNLGVFYVHGWGGLQSDIAIAKKLFTQAAELGQQEAKEVLSKETRSYQRSLDKVKQVQGSITNGNNLMSLNSQSIDLNLFVTNTRNEFPGDIGLLRRNGDTNWEIPLNTSLAF